MAHFNINNEHIELVHNNAVIKRFHILQDAKPLAKTGWMQKDGKTHLTIKTLDENTAFVVCADNGGYSYQHFSFGNPVGKHIFVSQNPDNPAQKTIKEFNYFGGVLTAYRISSFDTDRGVWNIQDAKRHQNGDYVLNCYCEAQGKKSKTAYYIFDAKGHKKEEGFYNTSGQKDGCMTTYDDKGNAVHTYYDNGKKLSLAQRIFHFKRKVSSHTKKPASQNVLTKG